MPRAAPGPGLQARALALTLLLAVAFAAKEASDKDAALQYKKGGHGYHHEPPASYHEPPASYHEPPASYHEPPPSYHEPAPAPYGGDSYGYKSKCDCHKVDPGLFECNGECLFGHEDRENCGGCGVDCKYNEICTNGTCTDCPVETPDVCDNECVDLSSDKHNCGCCGTKCRAGEECVRGMCKVPCTEWGQSCTTSEQCCDTAGDAICEVPIPPPMMGGGRRRSHARADAGTKCCLAGDVPCESAAQCCSGVCEVPKTNGDRFWKSGSRSARQTGGKVCTTSASECLGETCQNPNDCCGGVFQDIICPNQGDGKSCCIKKNNDVNEVKCTSDSDCCREGENNPVTCDSATGECGKEVAPPPERAP